MPKTVPEKNCNKTNIRLSLHIGGRLLVFIKEKKPLME